MYILGEMNALNDRIALLKDDGARGRNRTGTVYYTEGF